MRRPQDEKRSVQKKANKKSLKYILLWEIDDPMLGLVRVLMRRKDQCTLVCNGTTTTIKTRFGLSLDVEGSPWTRSLKVLSLLLDHTTRVVRWVSLTPLPDSVQRVADVLLRTRLGPLLPQPREGSNTDRHSLVQNPNSFQAWKASQDTLTISIHDTALRVSCPQGVTLVSQEHTTTLTEASRDLDTGALHTASAHSVQELEILSAWLYSLPGIELYDL